MVYETRKLIKKSSVNLCKGQAFFHAFIGYDTVSSYYKVGKANLWAVWLAKVKAGDTTLSNIFKKLSNYPMNIDGNEFDTLCNFFHKAYGLTKQAPFKTWQTDHLVSKPNVNLTMLVPSSSGILQHIK